MSKTKNATKELYTDHVEGDNPDWWVRLGYMIADSSIGLFCWRLINGGCHFCGFRNLPREIKWFFQRAVRGYSDDQLWSLDYHLGRHIVKCLKAFKAMPKSGYPAEYNQELTKSMQTTNGSKCSKKSDKEAVRLWNQDLQDMIEGFEFLSEKGDNYQECLKKCKNNSKKAYQMYQKNFQEATEKATKFVQHFNNLWD